MLPVQPFLKHLEYLCREKSKPLATNANKTVRENISNIFGAKFVQQMMPVEIKLDMSQSGSMANAGSEFESEPQSQDFVRSSEEVLPILEETELRYYVKIHEFPELH